MNSIASYTLENVIDYYPYGKVLRHYAANQNQEKYLSTHHQRDEETSTNTFAGGLDNRGARWYDSDAGRFLSLDPLAADFASWSSYNYVLGNPLAYIDPDGKSPDEWQMNDDGSFTLLERDNSYTHRFYNEQGELFYSLTESNEFLFNYNDKYVKDYWEVLEWHDKFQRALTRESNEASYEDMMSRTDKMPYGDIILEANKNHGVISNSQDLSSGLFKSLGFSSYKIEFNLSPAGILLLYRGATKGGSLQDDIKEAGSILYKKWEQSTFWDDVKYEVESNVYNIQNWSLFNQ